jgi:hypothetical protein
VGLEPASNGEDGALQLGRDALGDVVVGTGQVIKALGAGLQIAMPPLAKPDLGATERQTDLLDRAAAEAESDSALTGAEFVVPGCLRRMAAGGCPRRRLYSSRSGKADDASRGKKMPSRPEAKRCPVGSIAPDPKRCTVGEKRSDALSVRIRCAAELTCRINSQRAATQLGSRLLLV